jgi:uncharacterized Zn-binding protein involved in type VI secretion
VSRRLIVSGDKTSHGGVVVEASPEIWAGGTRIAGVGDKLACPLTGEGLCPIVTGDPTFLVDEKSVARAGNLTAFGAQLVASQALPADLC